MYERHQISFLKINIYSEKGFYKKKKKIKIEKKCLSMKFSNSPKPIIHPKQR